MDTANTIRLTRGQYAIVDSSDMDIVSRFNWCAVKIGKSFYAMRASRDEDGKKVYVYMHRYITGAPLGMDVDHINGNSPDNRRENLRICTRGENVRHRVNWNAGVSGYKGVTFCRDRKKKWCARIQSGGRMKHLGYYENAVDAARAYNAGALKHYGEYASLNSV